MNTPGLDDMLEREEAAAWLKMSKAELSEKSNGLRPVIPAFKLSERMVRFHPRTILAKLARDAGVPLETIAASFGEVKVKR